MSLARRAFAVLLMVALFSAPLYADVIPARRVDTSDAAVKVEARLVELGVTAESARSHASQLTEEEARYFASHPSRIQLAGQEMWGGQSDNLWWEWVFGSVFLAGTIYTTWRIVED